MQLDSVCVSIVCVFQFYSGLLCGHCQWWSVGSCHGWRGANDHKCTDAYTIIHVHIDMIDDDRWILCCQSLKVSESLSVPWIVLNMFFVFLFVGRCCFVFHQAVRIVASVLREGGEVADSWDHSCRCCHRIWYSKTRLFMFLHSQLVSML